jgi:hypothetical protein
MSTTDSMAPVARDPAQPLERQALDWLLARYPNAMLLKVDTQRDRMFEFGDDGPWLTVKFLDVVDVREFAIWKATGDVYAIGHGGAVEDDPIYSSHEIRDAERLLGPEDR